MHSKEQVIHLTRADRVFRGCVYLFLTLVTIIILFPLLNIIATSFSSYAATVRGQVWIWPVELQLETYKAVFSSRNIFIGYRNTIFYTVVGTCINLFVTICAAYPLSVYDLKGKNVLAGFFAFTMLFSGGMVPGYILVNKLRTNAVLYAFVPFQ